MLAGAAFLIRDGSMPSANMSIFEMGALMGGGRSLATDNYERAWD